MQSVRQQELPPNLKLLVKGSVQLIRKSIDMYGEKLVYPTSLGIGACVLIDMICHYAPGIQILTIDTGKLPVETMLLLHEIEERYGINIEKIMPDEGEVENMEIEYGEGLFRKSVDLRKLCCKVRKVIPLQRMVRGKAWLTGRRHDQSVERSALGFIELDPSIGEAKYNPLLNWSLKDIWEYVHLMDLPYNALYDQHYCSIGCEPCTRPISVGEDERAGRWWWENNEEITECGLHLK